MPKFTEFDPQNEEFDLHDLLAAVSEIGFDEDTLAWLLPFLQHPECLPNSLPEPPKSGYSDIWEYRKNRMSNLREGCAIALLACHDRAHLTRDALVVDLIQSILTLESFPFSEIFPPRGQGVFPLTRFRWLSLLESLRVDWSQGLRDVALKVRISHQLGIALLQLHDRSLFRWEEMIHLGKKIEPRLVDESRSFRREGDNSEITSEFEGLIHDPEGLVYWLMCICRSGVVFDEKRMIELFRSVETGQHLQVLTHVMNACIIIHNLRYLPVRLHLFLSATSYLPLLLGQMLHCIEQAFPRALFESPEAVDLRADWLAMRYSLQTESTGGLTASRLLPMQDPEQQQRWLAVAHEMLGVTRSILRLDLTEGEARFRRLPLKEAVHIVNEFGHPWRATKACLLALRELRTLSTGLDLRYWSEIGKDDPPELWSDIPTLIADQLRLHRRCNPGQDRMEEVRDQFATYLLDRLKSRKENKETSSEAPGRLTEPDPVWREAYVRALRELHANPGGRGHHVLYWVMGNDPDQDVQHQAKITYNQMRKNKGLPAASSPLTALFAAFWWLRQAHVISLGNEVDQAGASRTRAKEVRRTKEEFAE